MANHSLSSLSYADAYNGAYQAYRTSANLDEWVAASLHRTYGYRQRLSLLSHLLTLAHTQYLGGRLSADTVAAAHREARLAHLGWVITGLRPLQRRLLAHLWRPHGPLYTKHLPREFPVP